MKLKCSSCSEEYGLESPRWRCDCGAYLRLEGTKAPRIQDLEGRERSLWRYAEAIPITKERVSLGESITPLLSTQLYDRDCHLKLDYLLPTGSKKDRGIAVMATRLKEWKIDAVVEDSSGNAGASLAAYCGKAGIAIDVYVPSYTSLGKMAQIAVYGANLVTVEGTREDTTKAAMEAGSRTFYASHNWSPFFEHGIKTYVYEIWEQMHYNLPDVLIAPCGNGSLIVSAYEAINEIVAEYPETKVPRLVAVQSDACAPLATAWMLGKEEPMPIVKRETIAEGIASAAPLKAREVLQAVRETGGVFATVTDDELWQGLRTLAHQGVLVEPTSATAAAAFKNLLENGWIGPEDEVVIELTGNGLKAANKIVEVFQTQGSF
ncbi:MAG: threonine synthase [Bacillota bacterium]|jgi:threonine synthase